MLALAVGLWLGFVAHGVHGELRARRHRAAVRHRILVGGIRGKSTLVRLIHAGLAAEGVRAMARTTGDTPEIIAHDGKVRPDRRWGSANIREVLRFMQACARDGAQAAVVENMAVLPEYQAIVARRMVEPTIAVLSGCGPDHLEVLPSDESARARVLLGALPEDTRVVIPDGEPNDALERAACTGHHLVRAAAFDDAGMRPHMRALAGAALRCVQEILGNPCPQAAEAIRSVASRLQRIRIVHRAGVLWADALSHNDPDSTRAFVVLLREELAARGRGDTAIHLVFNHRADRPFRLQAFAVLLRDLPSLIVGERPARALPGADKFKRVSPGRVLDDISRQVGIATHYNAMLVVCGNSGGFGREIRRALESEKECEEW